MASVALQMLPKNYKKLQESSKFGQAPITSLPFPKARVSTAGVIIPKAKFQEELKRK
jgi:hypothetical protein